MIARLCSRASQSLSSTITRMRATSSKPFSRATERRYALASFQRATFDVVVTDIAMPGRDGFWLAQQIHSLFAESPRAPRLIAVTAVAPANSQRFSATGFDRYIAKPFDPFVLVDVILQTTSRR
jgi:CheY-like chemotaxis protein